MGYRCSGQYPTLGTSFTCQVGQRSRRVLCTPRQSARIVFLHLEGFQLDAEGRHLLSRGDNLVFSHYAQIDISIWENHVRPPSYAHEHLPTIGNGHRGPSFQCGIIRLLLPCIRPLRIDVHRNPFPARHRHDDNFRMTGLPFLAKLRIRQIAAIEISALPWPLGIDRAPVARFAIGAPSPLRLI